MTYTVFDFMNIDIISFFILVFSDPIWTPLIPASFSAKEVKEFGENVPMKRAGEPKEIAPCYVF